MSLRSQGWFIAAILSVGALLAVGGCGGRSAVAPNAGSDTRSFERLEDSFANNEEAFEAVITRMEGVVAANPEVIQISWILRLSCIVPAEGQEHCEDTTVEEQQTYAGLPSASAVVYQAKDGRRIFVRFGVNDPPIYHLMYAPDDDDPDAFARLRGFRTSRRIDDNWTILGPIPDTDLYRDQWLLDR